MPVERIPKPTHGVVSDAELERQYIGGAGWGTVEVESGGSQPLPAAHPTGLTVDTTTYSDPSNGTGPMVTLVADSDDIPALALAVAGDAFPRLILYFNTYNGIFMGDGTHDPTANGSTLGVDQLNSDGSYAVDLGGDLVGGQVFPTVGRTNQSAIPLRIEAGSVLHSGSGVPGVAGLVGDLYIRTVPSGANTTIYRCTVEGAAGVATWVGIL